MRRLKFPTTSYGEQPSIPDYSESYLRLGRSRIRLLEAGSRDSPPILFLHGIGGAAESALPHFPLASDYLVLAPDLPGFGRSTAGFGDIHADYAADLFADAIRGCTEQSATVVGLSMGALAGVHMVERHPNVFERLVAIGGTPKSLLDRLSLRIRSGGSGRRERSEGDSSLKALLPMLVPTVGRFREWAITKSETTIRHYVTHPELIDEVHIRRAVSSHTTSKATGKVIWNALFYDLASHLERVTTPVVLINGEFDQLSTLVDLAAVDALCANSEVVIIEGVGHWLSLECPLLVNDLLREVLAN